MRGCIKKRTTAGGGKVEWVAHSFAKFKHMIKQVRKNLQWKHMQKKRKLPETKR